MNRKRRDNEASSSAMSSEDMELEAIDESGSNSPIVHEENTNNVAEVQVAKVQLVSNTVDQLETMKYKTLQKENDQLQKENNNLRIIYNELKSSVGFMEENFKDDDKKVKYYWCQDTLTAG